ncbi:MAG: hypothetical protein ABFR05_11790 [Bacteroidota bacterium]
MGELEQLKNVWQKEDCKITFSKDDIYNMMQKKSSSVVKWILIISILEFILPNLFTLFTDYDATVDFYSKYSMTNAMKFYFSIHFIIILYFIYIFYKNYKNISAFSNVKELMHDIIKTRKTVKYYIYYNILMFTIIGIHIYYKVFNSESFLETLPENTNLTIVWVIALLLLTLTIFLFWGIYRIIYGFFLKKLNKNFKELEKTEYC